MTSYLVTGGSGYFGSLLVAGLATPGNRVRVLDLNDASDRPSDVEFVRGDVRDMAVVRGAVEGIDVVMKDDATASHHRRSARQGVLSIVKRSSSLLPEAR